jgi:SAM-dependent methyltransferase
VDDSTIARLLEVNRALYEEGAAAFSATRQKPWRGWSRLLGHLSGAPRPLRVLDAGCGNGRFGAWLAEALGAAIVYTGVDQSAPLLELARARVPAGSRLIAGDLISRPVDVIAGGEVFDLVAAMGVLHHVPSRRLRAEVMRALARATAPGGLLAVSFWSVEEESRRKFRNFREIGVEPASVEPGDHLLAFGGHGLRYCHHADEAERAELIASTGLRELDRWQEDQLNEYSLLVR